MSATEPKLSLTRKLLLWWMGLPASPHISLSVTIGFKAALAYLERINRDQADVVSINHFLVTAIGRTMAAFPQANARIIGTRIIREPHVGIAMPVDMSRLDGKHQEVGLAIVERVETMSLWQVAEASRSRVSDEKRGRNQNPVVRGLTQAMERIPFPIVARSLDVLERIARHPVAARQLFLRAPVTSVVSNVGAPLAHANGVLFRGAAIQPAQRLLYVGTVWGLSAVQDEVMVVDGVAEVRPAIPVVFVFDHRLIDGVAAGRMLLHLTERIRNPEHEFGPLGHRSRTVVP